MEEAAAVAQEFIQSLDNLPAEVSFILGEIRNLDGKSLEIEARMANRSSKILAHIKQHQSEPVPNEEQLQAKIRSEQERIELIAREKRMWASKLEFLMRRHLRRLNDDLLKLQESGAIAPNSVQPASLQSYATPMGRDPVSLSLTMDSLREATEDYAGSSHKKRKISVVSQQPASRVHGITIRNRIRSPSSSREGSPGGDKLKSGRPGFYVGESPEVEDAEPDQENYCFCHSPSYGEMIGCDRGDACKIEWFHLACVGLKNPVPEVWYCPNCEAEGWKVGSNMSHTSPNIRPRGRPRKK